MNNLNPEALVWLLFGGSIGYAINAGRGCAIGLAITSGICCLVSLLDFVSKRK